MEIQVVDEPKEVAAETQAVALRNEVDALKVVDQASYDSANVINKRAAEAKKAFHEWFDPIDRTSLDARQAVIEQRKKIDGPLDYAYTETAKKTGRYIADQREKALAEQRRAEEIARQAAEDAALATAQALADEGLESAAEAVLEAPVVVPRVEIAKPEMDAGTSLRTNYSAEVTDLMALVKSIAEGKTPLFYVVANDKALGSWAKLSKGTEALPGVKIVVGHKQSRTL